MHNEPEYMPTCFTLHGTVVQFAPLASHQVEQ